MDIMTFTAMCLVVIDHCNKIKASVTKINSPRNPVLRVATYHNWEIIIDLGKLSHYNTIIYE